MNMKISKKRLLNQDQFNQNNNQIRGDVSSVVDSEHSDEDVKQQLEKRKQNVSNNLISVMGEDELASLENKIFNQQSQGMFQNPFTAENQQMFSGNNQMITNSGVVKPQVPFLPKIQANKQYTLVLDLDETLIHYDIDEIKNEGFYRVRPNTIQFLKELSEFFEIVVFTAAIPEVILFFYIFSTLIGLLIIQIRMGT